MWKINLESEPSPGSEFARFLGDLFDGAGLNLPPLSAVSEQDLQAGDVVLADFERQWRLELPPSPPEFDLVAARWAALRLFRACQLTVYRDPGEEIVAAELSVPLPRPLSPAVHYSVDVTFRFLPDLFRFAQSASQDDPLIAYLQRFAINWPLSSVGLAEIDRQTQAQPSSEPFANVPCLLALYVDRILATEDVSRLDDQDARQGVRRALGSFLDLSPKIAAALQNYQDPPPAVSLPFGTATDQSPAAP